MASITMDIDPNVSLHLESSSSDGAVSFQPVKTNLEDFSRCFTVDLRDFSGTVTFHVRDVEAAGRKRKRVSDSNSNCSSNTETNTETNSNSNGTGKVVLNSVTPFHSSKKNQKQQPKSFSALTPQFGQTSPSSTQTQTTVLLHTDDVIQRQSQRSQRHLNLNLGFTDKNNDGSASDNDGNASENTYESSSNIINAEATAALKDSSPIRTTNATQLTLPPAKRWAHTATLIPAHGNSLLVYGGQNENGRILSDIFLYDVDLSSWSRPQNCDGLPRCWHSCTYVPQREVLVVFGGVSVGIDNKEEITDMTMLFDTDMMLWYPAETNGVRPVGRSGHSAALLGKQVLIFGGIKKSGRMQNSIAMLDVETWGWSVVIKDVMYVFGGNDDNSAFNTVHCLSLLDGKLSWNTPTISGNPPSPRTGACAVQYNSTFILIYGGWDPTNGDGSNDADEERVVEVFRDSFLLDTATLSWLPGPSGIGEGEEGSRTGHTMNSFATYLGKEDERREVIVFGGRIAGNRSLSNLIEVV